MGALTRATGRTGAVTLIQRFGSALNLNIHFHMLFLDGVYVIDEVGQAVFRPVPLREPSAGGCRAAWHSLHPCMCATP